MSRPRILHTEWSQGWGGQEIRIVAECRAFISRGYDMLLAARPDSRIFARAKEAGVRVFPVWFNSPVNPFTVLELMDLARREKVDIIHTHSSIDSWCGGFAAKALGLRLVRSRHLASPVKRKWSSRLLYGKMPDCVIPSGQAILRHLRDEVGCKDQHFISVPAGADPESFKPGGDRAAMIRELGGALEECSFVIAMVAVLRSWKGHDVLLDAVATVKDEFPSMRLLIVGDGPRRETLHTRVREMGLDDVVLFTGHRRDVHRVLAAVDVLVLPSLKNEATSQVIPQAMLAGVPVISSDAGGLSEIVRDGETGLLVPKGNADALAGALREVQHRPDAARERAQTARGYALRELTFERMIDLTEQAYQVQTSSGLPGV